MAGFSALGGGALQKVLGGILGSSLDPTAAFGDSRIYDYYNKYADSIYSEATAGQTFDPVSGSLKGGKDIVQTTIARMQADPETAHLFDAPATQTSGAGNSMGADNAARDAAAAAATAAANQKALFDKNSSTDLNAENKNLTIAGGSADAAASTVDDGGKKKRNPTGLASSLGINV